MTTITTTDAQHHRRGEWEPLVDREELHDLPYTPREGWTSVIALLVMVLTVAVAINDAAWAGTIPDSPISQTGFLPLAALFSVVIGILLAKSRLTATKWYILGALAGAAFLLFMISSIISSSPVFEQRMRDLNLSVSTFINESYVLGIRSPETSVFLLIIGAVIWAAGLFGAYSVFRRHRPLPVVALTGFILLINVGVTVREQYGHLVIFVAAALVLLMRLNLLDQTREWRLRGMRDVSDISSAFLRNGAMFVALAIVSATLLATNASSAPLARAWSDVDDELLEIGYTINRLLGGVSGEARGPNVLFTPSQTIRDVWQSSNEEVFRATTSDGNGYRWRGATYDSFDGRTWQQLDRQSSVLNPGDRLLGGSPEAVNPGRGWNEVVATVLPASFGGDVFVAPATPVSIDQSTEMIFNGAGGPFVAGKLTQGIETGVPYTVQSLVRDIAGREGLTASQLNAAGTNYPTWVRRYLDIRPGAIGDDVHRLARSLANGISPAQRTPYTIAVTVQDYLYRRGGFTYNTDLRGLCAAEKRVDCFLRIKEGFCEHFATAMVMMLRAADVPARYVLGYLPGQKQEDGSWRVNGSAAHAWVEVFFPNFGWVEFDPTPGNQENGQEPTRLQPGDPVGSSGDGNGGFIGQGELEGEGQFPPVSPGAATPPLPPVAPQSTSWLPLLVIVTVLVGLSVLGIWAAWRRVPTAEPEVAYWGITKLAARLGHGPRPAQTAYEFAAGLGDLMPVARDDLRLIATAKVEATYGRRRPGESLLRSLAQAYRRVRFGLLRLVIRRPSTPRRPRSLRRRSR